MLPHVEEAAGHCAFLGSWLRLILLIPEVLVEIKRLAKNKLSDLEVLHVLSSLLKILV